MGTLRVTDVVNRVETILKDENVRWKRVEIQNWLNESYLNIILLRPDANSAIGTYTCAPGTRQTLSPTFANSVRLLDVVRNVAPSSDKKAIRSIKRSDLDDQVPGWHDESETHDIQFFMFDPLLPKNFMVYPPATDKAQLEVVYSAVPTPHTLSDAQLDPAAGTTDTILLDDIYFTSIVDWVLYRAFSKDSENSNNAARAAAYYQTFMSAIGAKTSSDVAVSPSPAKAV